MRQLWLCIAGLLGLLSADLVYAAPIPPGVDPTHFTMVFQGWGDTTFSMTAFAEKLSLDGFQNDFQPCAPYCDFDPTLRINLGGSITDFDHQPFNITTHEDESQTFINKIGFHISTLDLTTPLVNRNLIYSCGGTAFVIDGEIPGCGFMVDDSGPTTLLRIRFAGDPGIDSVVTPEPGFLPLLLTSCAGLVLARARLRKRA
jgi:hypothetical protein